MGPGLEVHEIFEISDQGEADLHAYIGKLDVADNCCCRLMLQSRHSGSGQTRICERNVRPDHRDPKAVWQAANYPLRNIQTDSSPKQDAVLWPLHFIEL